MISVYTIQKQGRKREKEKSVEKYIEDVFLDQRTKTIFDLYKGDINLLDTRQTLRRAKGYLARK